MFSFLRELFYSCLPAAFLPDPAHFSADLYAFRIDAERWLGV